MLVELRLVEQRYAAVLEGLLASALSCRACVRGALPDHPVISGSRAFLAVVRSTTVFRVLLGKNPARERPARSASESLIRDS